LAAWPPSARLTSEPASSQTPVSLASAQKPESPACPAVLLHQVDGLGQQNEIRPGAGGVADHAACGL